MCTVVIVATTDKMLNSVTGMANSTFLGTGAATDT